MSRSPLVRINTRPQLIARIEAGDTATHPESGGAILVFLVETTTDPFFELKVDGGELPESYEVDYPTAKRAIAAAAELATMIVYDEVSDITETGEEDEPECTDPDATADDSTRAQLDAIRERQNIAS